jgi:DNA-binding response OmpR family regulator
VIKPHAASGGRRILLAEDDALTAALVIHRLEREGFEVEHRADGRSAVEAAEAGSFGLVLLDVHMPELDGFQVLARLRADARHAAVPIVMLTAVGSERDVVRGFELGADDYILKPFSPAELTARLRRFVRRD